MLDREGKSENLCDKKKSLQSNVVLRLPLQERPKVEKCLAHLLHYPRGEAIPTILKGDTERGNRGEMGVSRAKQQMQTVQEQQHMAAWS